MKKIAAIFIIFWVAFGPAVADAGEMPACPMMSAGIHGGADPCVSHTTCCKAHPKSEESALWAVDAPGVLKENLLSHSSTSTSPEKCHSRLSGSSSDPPTASASKKLYELYSDYRI